MKRRSFLKSTGVAAAATGLPVVSNTASAHTPEEKYREKVPELFEPVAKPPTYTPALVIGSGFGGAISAYRLAQAGIETTVLERGCRWPQDPRRDIHSNDFAPDGRAYWHRTDITQVTGIPFNFDKFGGILDVTDYDHISVWRGACVGGGSKVFTGVLIQPEREYFEEIFQDNVDFDEMNNTFYPRVREMLRVSPLPSDLYWKSAWGHSRVWDSHARSAGYTPESIDGIWNWDVVRDEYRWWRGNRRSATVGESNHGNANGAKFDLTQNYLKYAEDSGYTSVYSGTQVKGVSRDSSGNYLVQVEQIDPMGEVIDEYTLSCGKLFMAAGSIGTTELLLRARERGDLPDLNEHVGEGWGTNGDAAVVRTMAPSLGVTQASPSASKIHDASLDVPVTLENWYALHVPVNVGVIGSLGMGFDMKNRARFEYNEQTDSCTLLWPENGNNDVVESAREMNNKIAAASWSVPGLPGLIPDVNASFTAHPLGGVVLGKATDAYGRVHGYDGLYVMDGAMVNGSTGAVNPALTISALAERNIEKIILEDL
ncbi:cholesterol oxidase [Gammaproteobacteria bacterium 42_54_T18]|nr:cholesterol oxidase [Gammaproteobacteria bacterium 42_54_T18]